MSPSLNKIVIIDLEATCDEPKPKFESEIIEIGLTVVDVKNRKLISQDTTFVMPEKSWVTPFCTKLTSITANDLTRANGARSFPEAINWLKKFGTKNKPWASWGDYDRNKLRDQCRDFNVEYPFSNTHLNIKALFGLFEGLDRGIGVKEASEYYNLPWYGHHHRGMDDAINISNVFLEMLRRYDSIKLPGSTPQEKEQKK